MNRFVEEVALYGHADSAPKMLGDRDINVVISPLPRQKRGKKPHAADEAVPEHEPKAAACVKPEPVGQ